MFPFYFLLVVFLDSHRVSVLTDSLLTTCATLPTNYFETRAVVTFVLKKPYSNGVDVLVHGRGMRCELSPNKCSHGFTTAVIQQGRTKHKCVGQSSPCPQAEMCEPLGMTSQDGGMVSCRYRCTCPAPDDDKYTSCETILYSIGNGARAEIGSDIELCSINVDWYHWCLCLKPHHSLSTWTGIIDVYVWNLTTLYLRGLVRLMFFVWNPTTLYRRGLVTLMFMCETPPLSINVDWYHW